MKPKNLTRPLLAASALLSCSLTHAATYNWSGANNGLWNTDTNWSGSVVPDSADDLTILGPLNVAGALNINFDADNGAKSISFTNTAATTLTNTTSGANKLLTLGSGGITTGAGLVTIGSATANQGVNIALASNQTWTVGAGGLTMNSVISGTGFSLTKAGAGTLTLSRANTYTGGTTLSAGVLAISNSGALGTGAVSITGTTARINITAGNGVGLSIANPINVGGALTLHNPQTATGATTTFSGQLTGSSAITVVNGGGNGLTAGLSFTNANNTFTGNVIMPSGNVSGFDQFSFNSLGDGGNFTFAKAGNQNSVIYTGSAATTFNTRTISVGAISGLFDGGGTNPVNAFTNNGTGTITFNNAMSVGAVNAGGGTLFFNGTNAGNNTFAGTIGAGSGGAFGIGKTGTGKWVLTGSNSYTGEVLIRNGTLSVNAVSTIANNQPLGKNAVVQLGHQGDSGVLEFTGTTNSTTDKQFRIGNSVAAQSGGGSIRNNGTGSLIFSNAVFNVSAGAITATRTLNLGGSYAGTNEIQGVISKGSSSSGTVALTVSGSTWKLTNTSSYTGATAINNGTLMLGSGGNLGATAVAVANGGTLAVRQTASSTTNAATTTTLALNSGSALDMVDGFTSTMTVGTTATLAPGSGAAPLLTFDIAGANADRLAITGAATVGLATARIAISPGSTPTAGSSYNVITAASGLNTNFALANSLLPTANGLMSLAFTGSSGTTQVVAVSDAANALYWSGASDADWNSAGNWNTSVAGGVVSGSAPTTTTDVVFSTTTPVAANLSNSPSTPITVNSLNFLPGASSVTVGGSNAITVGTNINDNSGTNQTINAPLIVTGNLNKTAGGTLTLAGSNTISGAVTVDAGTLRLENGNAITATSGITTSTESALRPGNGTTIQLRSNADTTFNSGLISLPQGALNIDVNNIDGTTTGRTLTLGTASVASGGANTAMLASNGTSSFGAATLNVTGGNGYGLALGNIQQLASASGSTFTVNAGAIPVSINQFQTASFGSNFIVNSGTVTLGSLSQGSNSSNTLTVNAGGTLILNGATTSHNSRAGGSLSTVLNGSGTLVVNNAGALANTAGGANVPTLIINGGTLDTTLAGGITITPGTLTTPTMQWNGDFAFTGTENLNLGNGAVTMSGTRAVTVTNNTLTVGGSIVGAGLTKAGAGTLSLTGLSATAASNYSGTTTIGNGTLALIHASTAALTGGLTFGTAAGATDVGTLDLTNASASFGALTVRTNSASSNVISIGVSKTLTLTGSSVANVISVGSNTVNGVAKLQVTGSGTLTVDDPTRNIVVANTDSNSNAGDNGAKAELDLSGLANFNATVANIYVGRPTSVAGAGANGRPADTLQLAGNNNLTVSGVIALGGSGLSPNNGATQRLFLGQANIINAASFVVGSSRTSGNVSYNTGLTNPSTTLRGSAGGTSRTDIYLGDQANKEGVSNAAGGSTGITGTMDFTGGSVDAMIESLYVGYGATQTGGNRAAGNGTFVIDGASSVVDINTLVIAQTNSDNASTTAGSGPTKVASIGNFTMKNGTLRVNTAVTLANDIDTTNTTDSLQGLTANFNLQGGTATIGSLATPVNLILGNHTATGNAGLATATLNLTGGTLNMFGDIKQGTLGNGTIDSTMTLNGATLDMKGNSIGGSGALVGTLNFQSGTLQNVLQINNGAGLTKTTAGTLIIDGTNNYSGATIVSAGKLLINGSTSTSSAVTVDAGILGGTGTIGGSVTVKAAATLAPGASIESLLSGALTMEATSVFAYEVSDNSSTGADLLGVNGALTLTGVTLDLSLANAALSAGGWTDGDTLTLISYIDGGAGITSGFDGYADDTNYTFGSNVWTFDYNDATAGGNYFTDATAAGQDRFVTLTYTVIPEPSTALLGVLGALVLFRRRR